MHKNIRNKLSIIISILLIFGNKTLGQDFSENKFENPINNTNKNLESKYKKQEKKLLFLKIFQITKILKIKLIKI